MSEPCRILFHPALIARRAAEIARSQGTCRLERDACGRPFIRGADPLPEIPAAPRVAPPPPLPWLVRLMYALGREAGPPAGRPVRGAG